MLLIWGYITSRIDYRGRPADADGQKIDDSMTDLLDAYLYCFSIHDSYIFSDKETKPNVAQIPHLIGTADFSCFDSFQNWLGCGHHTQGKY